MIFTVVLGQKRRSAKWLLQKMSERGRGRSTSRKRQDVYQNLNAEQSNSTNKSIIEKNVPQIQQCCLFDMPEKGADDVETFSRPS